MNYGWLIDQRKCIGCHACTTACKSENEVPLSVDRTWVKYVEKGTYPNAQRHFGVLRCNHCANPPCVHICPTTAMFQRPNGIVEFNSDACIGCKACIAACPYDAIYIDPESQTAAKCNFCSHRLDVGLEPACVVVCPEEALVFGDLDDPTSKIAQLVGREKTQVRKPEKNTDPKCFYVGADESVLNPDVQSHDPAGLYMWSMQRQEKHGAHLDHNVGHGCPSSRGGCGNGGGPSDSAVPVTLERKPPGMSLSKALNNVTGARVAYDVHHDIPWGHCVSWYLWTKSIASGVFLVAWFLFAFMSELMPDWIVPTAPLISGIFLAVTGMLLIADLDRPERFWMILARPQWRSWLAIGSFIITGYAALLGVDFIGALLNGASFAAFGMPAGGLRAALAARNFTLMLAWHINVPLAVMTAVYTAFLFAQAKGRDLWQSPMLPFHLLVQAVIAGAAVLAMAAVASSEVFMSATTGLIMIMALVLHGALILVGEVATEHSSKAKQRAVDLMVHGPYARLFWFGALGVGVCVPILAVVFAVASQAGPGAWQSMVALASAAALAGLLAYEHCFVMAGQSIRLS